MKRYRSKDFCPEGVTRPLEIEIILDEGLLRIYFRTEELSEDIHTYLYQPKTFNDSVSGPGVVIESFSHPPSNEISTNNLSKIPLYRKEYSHKKFTREFTTSSQASSYFESFVRIIKSLRTMDGKPNFGAPDVTNKNKNSSQPKTTNKENKESYMNTNLTQIGTEVLSDNKEFAIFEAERATGLAALAALEKKMTEAYPGTESFWKSKLGTFILCNGIHAAGKVYDGPQSKIVHETTKIIMRGAYAKVGDSVNLNRFIESVFESVISVVPGMSKKTSGTSDATETK